MSKLNLKKEWERLTYKVHENKPKIDGPYPPAVVKRRELLLYAEVLLAQIAGARKEKDSLWEHIETANYKEVMSNYYRMWN